jgi:hypothetical protein
MGEYRNGKLIQDASLTNTGGAATLGALLGDAANSSLATRVQLVQNNLGLSADSSHHIQVTCDLGLVLWNTAASHEVFTITGLVRVRLWQTCTENVAGGGASIQYGYAGVTDAFIATTAAADLDAGHLWYDATPSTHLDATATVMILDYMLDTLDVGYEITGAAMTDGILIFHCVWEPLVSGATVVAGPGTAL